MRPLFALIYLAVCHRVGRQEVRLLVHARDATTFSLAGLLRLQAQVPGNYASSRHKFTRAAVYLATREGLERAMGERYARLSTQPPDSIRDTIIPDVKAADGI